MMKYKVGDIVEGTCTKVLNYGAFLLFDENTQGLLHISEISDQFIYNIANKIKVGMVYRVKVIELGQDGNFLKVSMKKITSEDIEKNKEENNNRDFINPQDVDFTELKNNLDNWVKEKKSNA